jgi:hypothetical protein
LAVLSHPRITFESEGKNLAEKGDTPYNSRPETAAVSDNVATIAVLKRKRDALLAQLQLLDEMMSELGSAKTPNGTPQTVDSPPIRADEFKGKNSADGLRLLMHSRGGQKINMGEAADALMRGGVHPGKIRGKQTPRGTLIHNLKIGLRQNQDFECEPSGSLAHVDVRDIFVRLRPAPDKPKERQRKPPKPAQTIGAS